MIYSRTDVDFIDHHKALAAGPIARDLWQWGNLYSRKHQLDGHLPTAAVLSCAWGASGKANAKIAAKLVEAGLWLRAEDGWTIFNYAAKNDTREEIAVRRADAAERQRRSRARRHDAVTRDNDVRHAPVTEQSQSQSQSQSQRIPSLKKAAGIEVTPSVSPPAFLPDPAIEGILQSALNAAGHRQRVESHAWRSISSAFRAWLPGQNAQEHWDSVNRWAKAFASDPSVNLAGVRMPAKIFLLWCNAQEGLGVAKSFVPYHQPAELPPEETPEERQAFIDAALDWDISSLEVAS